MLAEGFIDEVELHGDARVVFFRVAVVAQEEHVADERV